MMRIVCSMAHRLLFWGGLFCGTLDAWGQGLRCDPSQVMTTEACARCHFSEVAQWKKTAHFSTFETLARNPKANEITTKLGLSSVKRNELCIHCHFTVQMQDGKLRPIAGVSCESCHGASSLWIQVHNDFGGPLATKKSESEGHRQERRQRSSELGMRNTTNIYRIAQSCFACHTVPNERLVNVGGHGAGSADFELVAWSQGQIRHNFLRSDGVENRVPTPADLRVMYVAGLIADLEFSTRATAEATQKATYGVTVAERAARGAMRLWELQQSIQDPILNRALESFSKVELKTMNRDSLIQVAQEIEQAGLAFVENHDPEALLIVDQWLPSPDKYKN